VITMLGWGSWANTQKLAGKDKWPFQLYYWDYAVGVFVLGLVFMFTLGSIGASGMGGIENLSQAGGGAMGRALLSGALFNISNILLVVAIDAAGMSVAFPVGVGLALVIGTVVSYVQTPKGSSTLLFSGLVLVVLAMVMSAIAYSKLPRTPGRG
jgi:glucose uptake protein